MKVGVFGGTFDPVHEGHLRPAAAVADALALDLLVFVPALRAPGKESVAPAPAAHRVAMLALALQGRPSFVISLEEIDRGGTSYTVETLRAFRRSRPGDELWFLLGTDALAGFDRWREPREILSLARLAAFVREPYEPDVVDASPILSAHRSSILIFDSVRVKISSTDVRSAAASGQPLTGRTPPAVEEYIVKHGLYRDSGNGRI
ncbi:MAG TPA: nicotinate-nucleotide adenylyltransferase [Thermoanaerobaculia bacterium]|nr:nicotinate-nucleotide adenylyltransferase [Thermoanaerobaculia bacterium]